MRWGTTAWLAETATMFTGWSRAARTCWLKRLDGGSDGLDYSLATGGVSVEVNRTTPQTVRPNHRLTLSADIERFRGSPFADVVTLLSAGAGQVRQLMARGGRFFERFVGNSGDHVVGWRRQRHAEWRRGGGRSRWRHG